ncbi:hypothetical protein CRG98_007466 [Punica granatum]|uniref:Uncharacterized protein n=1 Tax=Punica granatum TaxID=22663 RepID=A0A2I0KUJ1_PUNGR|nr:hypothetical protein CRG98_007466 [Punica granatum]
MAQGRCVGSGREASETVRVLVLPNQPLESGTRCIRLKVSGAHDRRDSIFALRCADFLLTLTPFDREAQLTFCHVELDGLMEWAARALYTP